MDFTHFATKISDHSSFFVHHTTTLKFHDERRRVAPTLMKTAQEMLNDKTFGCVFTETRMESFIQLLTVQKIKRICDEMRKLGSNQRKASMKTQQQGAGTEFTMSFSSIIMIESLNMS